MCHVSASSPNSCVSQDRKTSATRLHLNSRVGPSHALTVLVVRFGLGATCSMGQVWWGAPPSPKAPRSASGFDAIGLVAGAAGLGQRREVGFEGVHVLRFDLGLLDVLRPGVELGAEVVLILPYLRADRGLAARFRRLREILVHLAGRVSVNLEDLLRLGEVEWRFALDELGPGAGCGSDPLHGLLAFGDRVALRQDGGDPDDGERGAGEKRTNHKRRLLR